MDMGKHGNRGQTLWEANWDKFSPLPSSVLAVAATMVRRLIQCLGLG
jgi:hypothetical protein